MSCGNHLLPQCGSVAKTSIKDSFPRHMAVIMDGNGRWAQGRLLPRTAGHAKGAGAVRGLVLRCLELGVPCLTLFAFSTENWQRPADEVGTLMRLFMSYLEEEMADLSKAGVRLKVIGELEGFAPELRGRILSAQEVTSANDSLSLCVAANYSGKWDIVQAVKAWQRAHPSRTVEELTQHELSGYLSTAGLPEVDLLIRTGGEQRVSNFLLWQCAYSEIYFTDVLWPEFEEKELHKALVWYAQRTRRFGKTTEQVVSESEMFRAA